jgi:hypothetical protein
MLFVAAVVNYKLLVKKIQEKAAAAKNQLVSQGVSIVC